ncbi:unnamed protein product, partial [Iphiclides podalirius]
MASCGGDFDALNDAAGHSASVRSFRGAINNSGTIGVGGQKSIESIEMQIGGPGSTWRAFICRLNNSMAQTRREKEVRRWRCRKRSGWRQNENVADKASHAGNR